MGYCYQRINEVHPTVMKRRDHEVRWMNVTERKAPAAMKQSTNGDGENSRYLRGKMTCMRTFVTKGNIEC